MCDLCAANLPPVKRLFVAVSFTVFVPAFWCLLAGIFSFVLRQINLSYIYAWKLPEYCEWALMFLYGAGMFALAKWSYQTGLFFADLLAEKLNEPKLS